MRLVPLILLFAGTATAAEPGHWRLQTALQGRNNQLGVGLNTQAGYRVALSDSDSLLLKGTHVEAGVVTQLSPASFHPGVYVQAVPIAPIVLRLTAKKLGYFGLFGTVVDYPEATSDWSPDALRENEIHARPEIGTAWEAMGILRLKVGPLLAMHEQRLQGVRMEGVAPGEFWYESINDLLVGRKDRIHVMKLSAGALVFGELDDEFLVVVAHWERYAAIESEARRQIAALGGFWRPDRDFPGRPTIAALFGTMPEDRYRQWSLYFGAQVVMTWEGGE